MKRLSHYSDVPTIGRVYNAPKPDGDWGLYGTFAVFAVRLMTSPLARRYVEACCPGIRNKEIWVSVPVAPSPGDLIVGYNMHDDQMFSVHFKWSPK